VDTRDKGELYLVDADTISLAKIRGIYMKSTTLFDTIGEIIDIHSPDISGFEDYAYQLRWKGKDVPTSRLLNRLVQTVYLAFITKGITPQNVSPAVWRQAITGDPQAKNRQVRYVVEKRLGIDDISKVIGSDKGGHKCDAIAGAIWLLDVDRIAERAEAPLVGISGMKEDELQGLI